MEFLPHDKECFNKLEEKFKFIFEPKLIDEICKHGQFISKKQNRIIVDIDAQITHMPLVVSGSIKVMTEDEEGDELLLYYLETGETCAITLNCFTESSRSKVRAVTETDVELIFIPTRFIEEWIVKYKTWRSYVFSSYNSRLNEMIGAIDNIVFHSLEERMIKYLRNKVWITKSASLEISHQEIANDLHTSRVAVSRIIKKLKADKVIEQNRNQITVVEFDV